MTSTFKDVFGFSLDTPPIGRGIPLEYGLYQQGLYTPSEERPVIRVRGKRRWYAPWKREPDKVYAGISEAMAFRAQQGMDAYILSRKG